MNKQKFFEDIKTILSCLLIGMVTFAFTSSLSKGIFIGVFILLFYFSYEKFFTLKGKDAEKFTEKITTIIGLSIALVGISSFIAWVITDFINGKIILF